jgi:hypothetical protein
MKDPALEWLYVLTGSACAFGKKNQRLSPIQSLNHGFNRIRNPFRALSVYDYRPKRSVNDVLAHDASIPVIARCHGASLFADPGWKGRTQEHEVHMTGVVGKVNPLHIVRATAHPAGLDPRQEPGSADGQIGSK